MFCRTRCLSNPFPVDRTTTSLFDVESLIFITMATSACLWQISVTPLYYPPSKTHCLVQDYVLHRVSKKLCQCYFVNNSVKHWPNLIIFGMQHREKT